MKQLFPLALLLALLTGCERPAAPEEVAPAPGTARAALQSEPTVDSYMRGYAKYEQCLWGYGACAVAVTEADAPAPDAPTTARQSSPATSRVPRVRLTLRQSSLHVQFLTPYDPEVKKITIRPGEEFFVAQPETDALGARAIKIKSGSYPIDHSWGENGGVRFNVQVY